jgi:hypothetical protein
MATLHSPSRSVVLAGAVALAGLALLAPAQPALSSAPARSSALNAGKSELDGVVTVSASETWAVGRTTSSRGVEQPLAVHRRGGRWVASSAPHPLASGYLEAVGASGSSDVWAVGNAANASGTRTVLFADHWDGRSWRRVAVPSPDAGTSFLYGVDAVSHRDAWAVGTSGDASLIEHWDGQAWSVVPEAQPDGGGSGAALFGVSADSAGDVWAVGQTTDENGVARPLAEHFDGTRWTPVAAESPARSDHAQFWTVTAVGGDDAWAVGFRNDREGVSRTLAEHWDGTSWRIVPTPDVTRAAGSFAELYGVAADPSGDVVTVGTRFDGASSDDALVERWTGRAWTVARTPGAGGPGDFDLLTAVSARTASAFVAVGLHGTATSQQALVMTWNGSRWIRQPIG